MNNKHNLSFEFVPTLEEAKNEQKRIFQQYSPYLKQKYGVPSVNPWTSEDGKEKVFIVWYRR